jgi:isopenicillin-N epimerase
VSRPDARALWSPQARHFTLDPARIFLNHGSFGACPRAVLEAQARYRQELEREPVAFMVGRWEELFDEVRAKLAAFLSCSAADLALVPNATHGVNTVLRSLELEPQDELLTTTHEYNATRNAMNYAAARAGARVVAAPVPFPIAGPAQVLEALLERLTPRTRLAVVDHVTSPTGLVLPLERIVQELQGRGIDVLVDGAHGPGMLPLALDALGAAYYTGNCHKWLCAPKGAAFLHVRADRQTGLRPLAISHGANDPRTDRSRFRLEFDFQGTLDPTPWLAIPAALEFLGGLFPGGWDELYRRNRALALEGRAILCEALGVHGPCPESMLGSLAAVPIPCEGRRSGRVYDDELQDRLVEHYGIQVPIYYWPALDLRVVRISTQVYNTAEQVRALAQALRVELGRA